MTLPASGNITAAMINVELGRASTAAFSINGAAERALAEKPSGAISFSDFHGKSYVVFSHPAGTVTGSPTVANDHVTVSASQNVTWTWTLTVAPTGGQGSATAETDVGGGSGTSGAAAIFDLVAFQDSEGFPTPEDPYFAVNATWTLSASIGGTTLRSWTVQLQTLGGSL